MAPRSCGDHLQANGTKSNLESDNCSTCSSEGFQQELAFYLQNTLPECLRIVAHLRRIGVFTESELRLQFLRCREGWLSGILDDLDQRNVYDYLKGMVNCHRMHLFDVVNQYRAIFSNDKSGNEENYDGGLLFSWSMHQIRNHLATLEIMLPKISEGGLLSNILDQCMRVLSIFSAVINLFSKNMSTAVENFQWRTTSGRALRNPVSVQIVKPSRPSVVSTSSTRTVSVTSPQVTAPAKDLRASSSPPPPPVSSTPVTSTIIISTPSPTSIPSPTPPLTEELFHPLHQYPHLDIDSSSHIPSFNLIDDSYMDDSPSSPIEPPSSSTAY
ncbi:hypothetical protein KSP40_PGU009065 [Platanthera guangdongensis]|uniref:Conserved oligomeric Golgi complex subunit 8 n=1 Tax=Platanthera guangdongensis TaxID=2320717 RepID=A0ABR2MYA5_9ASPA